MEGADITGLEFLSDDGAWYDLHEAVITGRRLLLKWRCVPRARDGWTMQAIGNSSHWNGPGDQSEGASQWRVVRVLCVCACVCAHMDEARPQHGACSTTGPASAGVVRAF